MVRERKMSAPVTARPLRLTPVSRDALSNRNILCRKRAAMHVRWMDEDWMFDLGSVHAIEPADHFVDCDWGGARVLVGVSRSSLHELAGMVMPGEPPARWPAPVMAAAIEFVASALTDSVEAATRKSLRIVSIAQRPDAPTLHSYVWHASSQERALEGELLLDATASRFLAAALREHPTVPSDADWAGLPLRLRLVVGWVDLSTSMLRSIGTRDVVLLDECLLSGGNQLMVMVSPRLGILCALEDRALRVVKGVQEIMTDVNDSVAAASGLMDDVPIRLTFDLGEREISLGDLRSIEPGYLFNLGRDPKSTVSIRANGRLIGDGELVEIEGRVGVSVLRFSLEAQ
jgi:type III secretion protein Q